MLDFFFVLGQVPGTSFQLTFDELVVFSVLWAVFLFYGNRWHLRRRFWRVYYAYGDTFDWLRQLMRVKPLAR